MIFDPNPTKSNRCSPLVVSVTKRIEKGWDTYNNVVTNTILNYGIGRGDNFN
jgi:hypothetical protein